MEHPVIPLKAGIHTTATLFARHSPEGGNPYYGYAFCTSFPRRRESILHPYNTQLFITQPLITQPLIKIDKHSTLPYTANES